MVVKLWEYSVYYTTCGNRPIFILIISAHIVNALLDVKM